MAKAKDVKKGLVVALEGGYWIVEEFHSQHQGRRGAVFHIKMRNLKSGHVIDRAFGEGDHLDEPEMQARRHQFSYADKSGYVFMDAATFEEIVVPAELIGERKWLLKEGGRVAKAEEDRMPTIAEVSGSSDPTKLCSVCGHPECDHIMHAELPYPTDGWITCPVPGCDCRSTWSVDEASRAAMEHYRAEYFRRRAECTSDPPATQH